MLREINCEKFIQNTLVFKEGLNSILGDDYSTNSIGKSTLLMIVDFVFGGSSFISGKDSGAIKILGELKFNFAFEFGKELFYYSRTTDAGNIVNICDESYNILTQIGVDDFTGRLKSMYQANFELSFRAAVGPYSRVWGKGNCDVDKPLFNSDKEAESVSVENLIKLFQLYDAIANAISEIKGKEEAKKILAGMFKQKIVPKMSNKDFAKNEREIQHLQEEVKSIQDNLLRFTLNVEELSSKEIILLKTEKQKLLEAQSVILNKIKRIEINLESTNIKSKHFKKLSDFFSNPNEAKIEVIASFHKSISKILQRELQATKEKLVAENVEYVERISVIDVKIDGLLSGVESPKFIVERIYDLTVKENQLKEQNRFFKQKVDVVEAVKKLNEQLDGTIDDILTIIQTNINNELVRINKEIHTEKKKIPRMELKRKSYHFDHSSNTGTGKSYADLIELDLAILRLTDLPFIIHDSVLFKNIEDKAVDKIIEQYHTVRKQVFIALDGINKFSPISQTVLQASAILHLSETRKLFNRDWR